MKHPIPEDVLLTAISLGQNHPKEVMPLVEKLLDLVIGRQLSDQFFEKFYLQIQRMYSSNDSSYEFNKFFFKCYSRVSF